MFFIYIYGKQLYIMREYTCCSILILHLYKVCSTIKNKFIVYFIIYLFIITLKSRIIIIYYY